MKRLIIAGALALTACAGQGAQVGNTVAAAEVALTEAETLALTYTSLPRCPQPSGICSSQATVDLIKQKDNVAYRAVKAAEGNAGLLNAAITAIQDFRSVIPAGAH